MEKLVEQWSGPSKALSVEETLEQEAVGRLAKIYALGMDLRDYNLALSAFAPDAVGMGKDGPEPIDTYLKATYAVAESFHATQHVISNQYISIRGEEADLWSYGVAHHKVTGGQERDEIIAGVQYRDKCRKFADGWLIVERSVVPMWIDMARPK